MSAQCDRCGEIGEDRRTLWMACFYAMDELPVEFTVQTIGDRTFYTLCVCKGCRASWMTCISDWYHTMPEDKPSCGSGIYIRRNGINVEVTLDEFNALRAEKRS
jgi:hypothetical protein